MIEIFTIQCNKNPSQWIWFAVFLLNQLLQFHSNGWANNEVNFLTFDKISRKAILYKEIKLKGIKQSHEERS